MGFTSDSNGEDRCMENFGREITWKPEETGEQF